ncbi:integral membrane TerC family protein [Neisseria meningitidis 69176]|nr:integral membrane TerC family protein [Neisseria meningitidis]EOB40916.1 integral membrane TerC family protein [Neisseria meningitidis 69176]
MQDPEQSSKPALVLGIDNLVFVAILANKVQPARRDRARIIGLGLANIVDEQKPVRRYLALAQRERFSKVLKHQVNRFRTICTVCGFVALS